MADRVRSTREVYPEDQTTTRTTRVVDDGAVTAPVVVTRSSLAARIVWFVAGVIITLLAFRFVFVLLGANPANAFANFIYTASRPFAAPFFGLFNYQTNYGLSRVEISTLVAMAVYALIAYGLARLFTIRERAATRVA